jgi:IS30 family transposase
MPYHQITRPERYRIHELLGLGWCPAQIARELGRARSTRTRERARNRTRRGRYEPYPAECYARTRRQEWWSPEQMAGRFRRTGEGWISYPTIDRRITEDERVGGTWHRGGGTPGAPAARAATGGAPRVDHRAAADGALGD